MTKRTDSFGILIVDKPAGMTSHGVVSRIRTIFGTKKVGHTGTLDPMATGVLVVCLGHATRIAEYLTTDRKEYSAGVTFGIRTESQDVTGEMITESDASHLTRETVEGILSRFRGRIRQIPPMVSALHHKGQRLYELARKGIEVERESREIEIYCLELAEFSPGAPAKADLLVECSTGTYIRTLAADIGDALGVGAILHSLRRTRVGRFTESDSVSLEDLESKKLRGALSESVLTIQDALPDWPRIPLTEEEYRAVTHGQTLRIPPAAQGPHFLLHPSGCVAAVAEPRDGDSLAPVKVFVTE